MIKYLKSGYNLSKGTVGKQMSVFKQKTVDCHASFCKIFVI